MEHETEEAIGAHAKAFSEIIGQDEAIGFLKRVLAGEKIPHAYLFLGVSGVGKTTTALSFGRALNCLEPQDTDGCGRCVHCRQMAGGNFPDLETVRPDGRVIRIEQVRELTRRMGLKTVTGRYRLSVLERAETMTVEAANAFLKTLEEPPPGNVLVLTASDQRDLLPTILSRCQKVRFRPVQPDRVASWLQKTAGVSPAQASVLARLSEGSPGRALRMARSDDFGARCADHLRVLMGLHRMSRLDVVDLAVRYARETKKESGGGEDDETEGGLHGVLSLWKTCLRDMLLMKTGKGQDLLIHMDDGGAWSEAARTYTAGGLVDGILALERAQRDLGRARNRELMMETTLLSLRDLAGGGGHHRTTDL